MTDLYLVDRFNQRVEYIEGVDKMDEDMITETATDKRYNQIDQAFENGEIKTVRTYNELQDILDEISESL